MSLFISFLKKDLYLLFFATKSFSISCLFSVCLLTLFNFLRFDSESILVEKGIYLYISFYVSSLFILIYTQDSEKENGVYHLLKLISIDFTTLYLSKSISCFIALFLLWLFNLFCWSFFFDQDKLFHIIEKNIYFIGLLLAGFLFTLAISFLGIMVARISIFSKFHLATLLILFFPLSLPIIIASNQIAWSFIGVQSFKEPAILLSIASIFIYGGLGLLTYNILMED